MTSILFEDATALAQKLESGELSSEQLTRETLSAIDSINAKVNCYISLDAEGALAAARASDKRRSAGQLLSAIDGLTVALKDNIDVAGMVTTGGLNMPQSAPKAERDAFAVQQLRAAGCVILGKLNMHEAALGASNDNPHHGKCFNPHLLTHTPGGSSGGSGAAVAAGLCAFALGTDTMGSVRIPASYCGVAGIKPTAGAVSIDGTVLLSRRLDNIGPLARSARDLALILPLMAVQDIECAQSRAVDFKQALSLPAALNFAVANDLSSVAVEASVMNKYREALQQFERSGAQLHAVTLSDFDFGASRRSGLLSCEVDMYIHHQAQLETHPEYYSEGLKKMMAWGCNKTSVDVMRADVAMDAASIKLSALLDGVDFLLLPTAPQAAFDFAEAVPAGQADLTNMANMSGHPAISVPMGTDEDGLPVGLQIIGPHGSDLQLIQLAQWFSECSEQIYIEPLALNGLLG